MTEQTWSLGPERENKKPTKERIAEMPDEKLEELIKKLKEEVKELEDAYYRETDQVDEKRNLKLAKARQEAATERERTKKQGGFYSSDLLSASFSKEAAGINEAFDEWIEKMTALQEEYLGKINKLKRKKDILEKERGRRSQQAYEELDTETKKRMQAEKFLKQLASVGIKLEDEAIQGSLEKAGFSLGFLEKVKREMEEADSGK